MRRWGYGLAGFLALMLLASNYQSDEPVSGASPTPSQTASASASTTTSSTPSTTSEPSEEQAPSTESETSEAPSLTPTPSSTASQTQTAAAPEESPNDLEALLLALTIEDEFPSGYDRDLFRHWVDADGDGCNARREVLIVEAVEKPSVSGDCDLVGGSWDSVYDGVTTTDPSRFDVDHMVPLKEAWDSGAHAWGSDRRRAFANDLELPGALIAVSASSNRSKSDRDPADWLPPVRSYHCQYIEDWMLVKIKWELSVDAREFNALRSFAAGC